MFQALGAFSLQAQNSVQPTLFSGSWRELLKEKGTGSGVERKRGGGGKRTHRELVIYKTSLNLLCIFNSQRRNNILPPRHGGRNEENYVYEVLYML